MTFVQSMGSRGNILSGPGLNRMELLSALTGPWNRESSVCFTRLVSLSHSGVKLLLPSSMSGTGPPPLLYLAKHPMKPSLGLSLMSLCCVSGAVLPMSTSRRTRGTGEALDPIWRSVSSLATLMTTRGGSSTIPPPKSLLSQSVLSLMSATSLASRILPLPSLLFPPLFLNTHPPPPFQLSSPHPPLLIFLMITQMEGLSILTLRMCMIMGEIMMGLITHILLLLLVLLLLIPCHYLLPLLREPGLRISHSGYHPCLLNLLPHPKSTSPLLPLFLALLQGNHFHQLDLLLLSLTPSQLREDQLEIPPLC